VNRLSQVAGLAAIEDRAYTEGVVQRIKATRSQGQAALEKLGWFTYPSQANFLFSEPRDVSGASGPEVAQACFEHLVSRKVLVRYFPSHALTRSFLRITVGTDSQMRTLFEAIESWLKNV
jgi:histidinol-phosphate aminotransferase